MLQRARVEALVQAAGLHIAAWDSLSERYHVHTRPDEECDRLLDAYQQQGAHPGYIGGCYWKSFIIGVGRLCPDGADTAQRSGKLCSPGMNQADLFY